MKDVSQLHREAMELSDSAERAAREGRLDESRALAREAMHLEAAAAELVENDFSLEPTRSVLLRSAASLALDCNDFRRAEQLIASGLRGSPPPEIADELRDLFENATFARHLALRGVALQADEFQMSLDGPAIGYGVARSDYFLQRVRDLELIIYRTAERRMGRDFREGGRRNAKLAGDLELYLTVPRAASFAVTFKIGRSQQLHLPGIDFPRQVIDDLLDCLEMVNKGDDKQLISRIPDESYRRNFVALARALAPDGRDVRTVGFTAGTEGGERSLAFDKPRPTITPLVRRLSVGIDAVLAPMSMTIRGSLLEADAKSQLKGEIEVVDAQGLTHRIEVPRGMMRDIVRPMFEEQVIVQATRLPRGGLTLDDITLADEGESESEG